MKTKTKSFLSIALLLSAIFPVKAFACEISNLELDGDYQKVVVDPPRDKDQPYRGLTIPFDMYYYSGSITADFYSNIGDVTVIVMNTSTGQMWSATMDSSLGTCTMDISTANWQGYYELTIIDGQSNSYSGYWTLDVY